MPGVEIYGDIISEMKCMHNHTEFSMLDISLFYC
jgi:hypothetical protein